MATKSLVVELDAKTDKLDKKLKKTETGLDGLGKKSKGAGISLSGMGDKAKLAGAALISAGAAAATAAVSITALVGVVSGYAREIKVASQLSGVAVEKLQLMAHATSTVGIGIEDLGDKFKDSREKIGDFLNTGGGGFMDFVDAMKLTKKEAAAVANEFKHLSGDQILQQMVTRMQDANVSAVQMSHALEGMASDTTKLIPLLMDGGREMKNLMEAAKSVSIPLSQKDINKFVKMGESADLAGVALKSLGEQILLDLGDSFMDAANKAAHFYASLNKGTEAQITTRLASIKDELAGVRGEIEKTEKKWDSYDDSSAFTTRSVEAQAKREKQILALKGKELTEFIEKEKELLKERQDLYDDMAKLSLGVNADTGLPDKRGDKPKGDDKPVVVSTDDEIQAIKDRFQTEEDLLFEKYERELAIVGENQELRLSLDEQYLADSVQLEADAAEKKKKISDDELKREEKISLSKKKLALSSASALIDIARSLFGENEKIAKAMFIADKAVAVSNIFVNTQVAASEAQVIDPTGALAAVVTANGYIRMAAVAASTIGGMSSGGGGGISGGSSPTQTQQDQQQNFQEDTSRLDLSDANEGGSRAFNVTLPDSDELGQAIASWLNKAKEEGQV